MAGKPVALVPTAIYCYTVGRDIPDSLRKPARAPRRRTRSEAAEQDRDVTAPTAAAELCCPASVHFTESDILANRN